MPEKKSYSKNSGITIKGDGNIVGNSNIVSGSNNRISINNISNSDINVTGLEEKALDKIFYMLRKKADATREGFDKQDTLDVILKIEEELIKGDAMDEGRVGKWFRVLSNIAPDLWEMAIESLSMPGYGISLTISKVIRDAKEGRN